MGGAAHEVAATLNALEGKLRELERELLRGSEPAPVETVRHEHAPAARRSPRAVPPPDPLAELVAFKDLLERSAGTLIAEYERVLDRLRSSAAAAAPEAFSHGSIGIEVGPFPDVAALLAFERAVLAIPGAREGRVRSYDGATATVHVTLGEPVALVSELRRVSPLPFAVVQARPGAIVLELSSGA